MKAEHASHSSLQINQELLQLRIAVLGASGFVGSWVSRILLDNGLQPDLYCRRANPEGWGTNNAEHVIEGNLLGDAWDILSRQRYDVVFNLLGYGIRRHQKDHVLAYQVNAFLPAKLARLPGQPFIVQVGSALEYGNVTGDLREDTIPNPTDLYGITKLLGTYRFLDNLQAIGSQGVVARLFMLYGPGEPDPRLLPGLIKASKTGEPIPMTEGLQRRDFTHVEEAAEGLIRLGFERCGHGEIVNLSTGTLTSIREFVETAARLLKLSPDQLLFGRLSTRSEEMQHEPVNTEKLEQLLKWRPSLTVQEGIAKTLAEG